MATATDSIPWGVLVVLLAVLLVPPLVMVLAMPMMGYGMMGWGMGGGGAGVVPLVALVTGLVPLVVLLAVGYLAYRAFAGGGFDGDGHDPALQELRLAFARGDLSREEFEERRELLEREQ